MVLTDLPYGITQNKWDVLINLDNLWTDWKRVLVDNGVIVLCASQPFTTYLISSNPKMYKYSWVWKKGNKPTGFLNAKKQPLRITEDILVFYNKQCTYNPQMIPGDHCHSIGKAKNTNKSKSSNYGEYLRTETNSVLKYPQTIIDIPRDQKLVHPTQKPVALFEYLIKTYTNEGDTVLDSCLGSGTTLEACKNTNRNCIGYEIDPKWEQIIYNRLINNNFINRQKKVKQIEKYSGQQFLSRFVS